MTKQDLFNTKYAPKTEEESRLFQEAVFNLGVKWMGAPYIGVQYTDKYLFISGTGRLAYSTSKKYFNDNTDNRQIYLEDVYKPEIALSDDVLNLLNSLDNL